MSGPSPKASALLRRGPFARYIAGDAISMMGSWMQQMAQGWVLAGLTTSAFTLGLVNFAAGIPMLALTMFGGIIADRHDKRLILGAVLIVQAGLAVGVGWLIATNQIAIWHITVAGILLGISAAFEMPAASAIIPELVAKEELQAAIAIDRSVFHATRLVGPALGGWIIGALGTASAFYVNAASYAAMLIALGTIQPRQRGSEAEEKARQGGGMRDGFAHVRADEPTRTMIILMAVSSVFIPPFFMVLMPIYSRQVLGFSPKEHGLMMAASGVGALIGSARLLGIAHAHRLAYLRGGTAVVTLAMAVLARAHLLSIAMPAMMTLSLGTSTIWGLANTVVQERAPDPIRGRISAIAGLSFFGVMPFAGLLASKFADFAGMRTAMLTGGISFAICAAILLRSKRCLPESPIASENSKS